MIKDDWFRIQIIILHACIYHIYLHSPHCVFQQLLLEEFKSVFVYNIRCLLFALCCFPRLTVSAWWGVSCPSGQQRDSHIMSSPSYKLQLMVRAPFSQLQGLLTFQNGGERGVWFWAERTSLHICCLQTHLYLIFHFGSRWRVYEEYSWCRKWLSAWLLLNTSCSVHTDSEHQLERSDSWLDLSLWIACGKRELACYSSTWTCFNLSLSSLEGGMHVRNAKSPSSLMLFKMKLNFLIILNQMCQKNLLRWS